jgi:hypothetical protein
MSEPLHHKFGPSSLGRLALCPGSAYVSEGCQSEDTDASERGTLLHHATTFGGLVDGTMDKLEAYDLEMVERAINWSLGYGQGALHAHEEFRFAPLALPGLSPEERPFGTCDRLYRWADRGELHDFKFGPAELSMDVLVPQMEGYVAMALAQFPILEEVAARAFHVQSGEEFVRAYTREALPELLNRITETILGAREEPVFLRPSELACKYCPGKVRCPALSQMAVTLHDLGDLVPSGPVAIGEMLSKAKAVKEWAESFIENVKRQMRVGLEVEGWGLEKRAGRRQIRDVAEAYEKLRVAGMLPEEILRAASLSVGEAEKAFHSSLLRQGQKPTAYQSKERMAKLLEGVIESGPGTEALVARREKVIADETKGMIENE